MIISTKLFALFRYVVETYYSLLSASLGEADAIV